MANIDTIPNEQFHANAYSSKKIQGSYPQNTLAVGVNLYSNVKSIPEGAVVLIMDEPSSFRKTQRKIKAKKSLPSVRMAAVDTKTARHALWHEQEEYKKRNKFKFIRGNGVSTLVDPRPDTDVRRAEMAKTQLGQCVTVGVVPDTLALSQRHVENPQHIPDFGDAVGVYVSGVCNVRCRFGTAQRFKSNDLVYVDTDKDGFFCAVPDQPGDVILPPRINTDLPSANAIRYYDQAVNHSERMRLCLGTCIEDGQKGDDSIRVNIDNALNIYRDFGATYTFALEYDHGNLA